MKIDLTNGIIMFLAIVIIILQAVGIDIEIPQIEEITTGLTGLLAGFEVLSLKNKKLTKNTENQSEKPVEDNKETNI